MRLEISGLLHRNDMIEQSRSPFERIVSLLSCGSKLLKIGNDIGKRLEFFDLANEPAYLLLRVRNTASIHDI